MKKDKFFQKIKTIKLPVFQHFKFTIIVTSDCETSYTKRYGEPHGGLWYACCGFDNKGHTECAKIAIFLPFQSSVNTIAHESYHAIQKFMEVIGENNKREFFAYHLGYLTGEIYDFFQIAEKEKKMA